MSETDFSEKPWLSVLMPVQNGERWIAQALGSIAAEMCAGIEVLIIDSSSTPETLDIARTFRGRLNLRIFERYDFLMWHSKTNFGANEARADHICWLHHDDIWLPGRTAAVKSWINAAPQAVLHIAPSMFIDADGAQLGTLLCPLDGDGQERNDDVVKRLLVQNFIAAPAPVIRKDAWLNCGGLDETLWYTADWDMWLKLLAQGPAYYHHEVTTGFRIHGFSLTISGSRDINEFIAQMRTVFERHLPALSERDRAEIERIGSASIEVNAALACAAAGDMSRLLKAAATVMRLGPRGVSTYLYNSRLADRMGSRMRAKSKGAM
jgi:glycosyltransferase involved in cell wall biosynthesis